MKIELKPLAEQVVVVLGASSGIGRATAIEANRRGASVVAAARGMEALATLRDDVEAPERLEIVTADAADHAQVRAVGDAALDRFGRIDTWAHVAGIAEWARFEDITPEEFRRVVEVDLLGPVHGAMVALAHLRRAGGGAYVVVSSEIAKRSFPLLSSYAAAKHGVDGFVEALRVELEHEHVPISITQVMPAAVATPFFEHARTRLGVRPSGPPPVYSPEQVAEVILRAAEHPTRDVAVGGAGVAQLALQRLSPRVMDAFTRATAFRLQRSKEPKDVTDSDNLDAPVDRDDRIHGVVTTTHR